MRYISEAKTFKIKVTMTGPRMATKGIRDVKDIIYKKIGMDWVFKWNYSPTYDEVHQREKVDVQIERQYEEDARWLTFRINL